ncbi:MAG: PLP-dependent aminotransferase family protein [Firmicutes bacterium]|nr:PLP-dependent aminotransferase family protein [Bacillota bacterium]
MQVDWEKILAARAKTIVGFQIRSFFHLTEKPEVISFAGGFPADSGFPTAEIKEALACLLETEGKEALQYGPTEGIFELRQFIARKMAGEGISAPVESIMITNGSQQGLDLVFRLLLDPHDYILVEEPGYIGGLGAIQNYQGTRVGIPLGKEGLDLDYLEKKLKLMKMKGRKPKCIYTIPNFQNPTGAVLPLEGRRRLLELASEYDFLIVEDNPYGEICFEGEKLPSIKSLDKEGRVIYLGSFSKIFVPGIRVGWVLAPAPFMNKLILAKQATDLCSNSLGQRLLCQVLRSGFLAGHVEKLVKHYRLKRDIILESMERYFPPQVQFTRPRGGFFTWVSFPSSLYPPAGEILLKALERKVAFVHGDGFYSTAGKIPSYEARFSFSQPAPEQLEEGIKRLGQLLYEMQRLSKSAAVSGS